MNRADSLVDLAALHKVEELGSGASQVAKLMGMNMMSDIW
jgi:hypothetical protein